jgi:TnpA family transposase
LDRAVRTGFLLRYISDPEMRKGIQGAMNKSEQFNKYLQWSNFGRDELRSNDRDLLRKIIKFQHLVANCLIFYTGMAITRVLKNRRSEGLEVSREVLERLSPYRTEHLNRFGEYHLNLSREIPEPDFEFIFV